MQKIILSAGLVLFSAATIAQSNKVLSAYNYLNRGDLAEAQAAIDAAAVHEKTMSDPKTFLYRGNIYKAIATSKDAKFAELKVGAAEVAAESYAKALELEGNNRKITADDIKVAYYPVANIIFTEGIDAYNASDFATASTKFEKTADIKSGFGEFDTLSYYNAGLTAEQANDAPRAIMMYEKVKPTGYKGSRLYYDIARLQMEGGDTDAGAATITEGLEKYPGDKNLMLLQTNMFLQDESKIGEAIENLNVTIAGDPENPSLYYARGTLLQKDPARMAEAEADFMKTIELDPEHFEANYNLGALYVNQSGTIQEEMNALDFSEQKKYDELKTQRDDLFKKAIGPLEKALALNPDEKGVQATLLELYGKTGQTDKYNEMKARLGK